ncbi:MAG: glycosyltransferase [Bacteroidetes bacterium]|nr:glycosyltransferase [Bacteroidota bacterium]
MPAVSVIMPVYNAETTIEQALRSICTQTFADLEILVWNDGSTDRTQYFLEAAASRDKRIKLLGTAENNGIVHALRGLTDAATAPLLARMDADDVMHPERIAQQVREMKLRPGCGLVSSLVTHGGHAQLQQGYAEYINWINSLKTPEAIRLNRFVESPLAHPSVLFRAALIVQHGGYRDGHFPEDYELWLRWLDAGVEMRKLPQALLQWNDLPGRLSRTHSRYGVNAFHEIKAEYLARELRRIVNGREIWLCGAGRITRKRSNYLLEQNISIAGYIDVNPALQGKTAGGFPVIAPGQIASPRSCFVVSYITNRGARREIAQMLESKGFVNGQDYMLAG